MGLLTLCCLTFAGRWHIYLLTILYIIFINSGSSSSVNPLSLWLKSEGYPVTKVVSIPPPPLPSTSSLQAILYLRVRG